MASFLFWMLVGMLIGRIAWSIMEGHNGPPNARVGLTAMVRSLGGFQRQIALEPQSREGVNKQSEKGTIQ